jgi:hypothetical protein
VVVVGAVVAVVVGGSDVGLAAVVLAATAEIAEVYIYLF